MEQTNNTYHAVIPARLAGMNELVNANRSHWTVGAKLKQEQDYICVIGLRRLANKLKGQTLRHVFIEFTWVEKDKRRDKDNICSARKFILDAMQKVGIIENDGWEEIKGWSDRFIVDKQNPRVELVLVVEEE